MSAHEDKFVISVKKYIAELNDLAQYYQTRANEHLQANRLTDCNKDLARYQLFSGLAAQASKNLNVYTGDGSLPAASACLTCQRTFV